MKTLRELKDFSKTLVLDRFFDKIIVGEKISEFLGFKIKLDTLDYEMPDYCICENLFLEDRDLYFHIFYLIDRDDFICITEFNFDSNYTLYEEDLDKKIIGVAQ